jgi:hypothetical protein
MWRRDVGRRLCLCLFLAWINCGSPAVASMIDFSETSEDIEWMFGMCLVSGTLGFGLGAKIRLTRDIANAA